MVDESSRDEAVAHIHERPETSADVDVRRIGLEQADDLVKRRPWAGRYRPLEVESADHVQSDRIGTSSIEERIDRIIELVKIIADAILRLAARSDSVDSAEETPNGTRD